ncbi:hypothetical protein BGZ54_003350 [Gamsiella multidivaricata]|nr:hypothetical protein BGZ54_003350 [Gamsiella multidivaricata]
MKIMHDILRHGQSDTPIPSGDNLSLTRKALYTYICANLEDRKTALQHEQGLLVALPGGHVRHALINDIEESALLHIQPNPVYFITWKAVLDFISEGLFKFETGELTSNATKEIRTLQEQEFSRASKGVCGRKMDLHLHFDSLELNNSEFKAVGVDIEENKKQSRKNIRINKAIMDYLQRHAKFDLQNGDYMVFLDVSGYTSTIVYLRRYEDIYVPGLLSRVAIKLPFIRLLPVAGWKNSVVDYSLCETGQLSKVDAESDAQLTIEYMLHEARELEQSYRLAKSLSMF